MIRIVVGALLVAGGLSGRFVLLGTESGIGLVVVGGLMIAYGLYQVLRRRSDQGDGIQ